MNLKEKIKQQDFNKLSGDNSAKFYKAIHNALSNMDFHYIERLYADKSKAQIFQTIQQEFVKDHSENMSGNNVIVYRGLSSVDYESFNLGNKKINDIITLTTYQRPIQSFSTDRQVAVNFAIGDISQEDTMISLVLETYKVSTKNIVWYYDSFAHKKFSYEDEKEVMVYISKQGIKCKIIDVYAINDKPLSKLDENITIKEFIDKNLKYTFSGKYVTNKYIIHSYQMESNFETVEKIIKYLKTREGENKYQSDFFEIVSKIIEANADEGYISDDDLKTILVELTTSNNYHVIDVLTMFSKILSCIKLPQLPESMLRKYILKTLNTYYKEDEIDKETYSKFTSAYKMNLNGVSLENVRKETGWH